MRLQYYNVEIFCRYVQVQILHSFNICQTLYSDIREEGTESWSEHCISSFMGHVKTEKNQIRRRRTRIRASLFECSFFCRVFKFLLYLKQYVKICGLNTFYTHFFFSISCHSRSVVHLSIRACMRTSVDVTIKLFRYICHMM